MKPPKDLMTADQAILISKIPVNRANLQHISETGKINGSLAHSIKLAMDEHLKAANESVVERLEKIRSLTLSLRAYHSALTSNEIDNQLAEIASINEQLIKELTASE